MSLIKTKIENGHKIVKFLGLKFKFLDKKALKKFIIDLQVQNNKFITYSNIKNWTAKEKIWFLTQRLYTNAGYFPNFKKPRTFNEKLNWMKLNYYNPIEKIAIDKYEFKNYIKEKLGDGYTIPLIAGPFEDVNDIDFKSLPERFVIKTTGNGSASGVEIVKDKKKINIGALKFKFNNLLQEWNKAYYGIMARGHKDITPRIIIEEYIEQPNGQLYDYKFHCFHGEVKLVLGVKDRKHGEYCFRFYDTNWNPINLHRGNKKLMVDMDKPKNYDKMLEISRILSKDFPFVRVDFYETGDKIYVGELTFTPKGGFGKYDPIDWDYKMGEWLDLNKLNPEYVHLLPEFRK